MIQNPPMLPYLTAKSAIHNFFMYIVVYHKQHVYMYKNPSPSHPKKIYLLKKWSSSFLSAKYETKENAKPSSKPTSPP